MDKNIINGAEIVSFQKKNTLDVVITNTTRGMLYDADLCQMFLNCEHKDMFSRYVRFIRIVANFPSQLFTINTDFHFIKDGNMLTIDVDFLKLFFNESHILIARDIFHPISMKLDLSRQMKINIIPSSIITFKIMFDEN